MVSSGLGHGRLESSIRLIVEIIPYLALEKLPVPFFSLGKLFIPYLTLSSTFVSYLTPLHFLSEPR